MVQEQRTCVTISTSKKAKLLKSGVLAGQYRHTKQVVYKILLGKNKKRQNIFSSKTVHEAV